MKRNLFKRITALTVAGVSAITVASCTAKTSPMETIENAVEVNIDKFADSEIFSNFEKFCNGGSVELKGNLSKIIELATGAPMDLDASLKMYTDMDAKIPASAVVAALGMNETTLIDVAAYFTQENMALKSSTLLGDDAYGITYENFTERFENSIFGPGGEYDLGIDEETFAGLTSYFEALGNTSYNAEVMKNFEESIENLVDELKPSVYKALEAHGNAQIVDGTVTLAENEVKTADVTLNFGVEGVLSLAKDTFTAVKDSKNLKPAIEAVRAYLEASNNYAATLDPSEASVIPEFSTDEAYSEIITALDEALASLNEADLSEVEIPELNFSVVAHIAKKTGELLSVSFGVNGDDTPDVNIELILANSLSPDFGLYIESEGTDVAIAYNVTTNTDTAFESALTIKNDGTSAELYSLKWDKTTGEYTSTITNPESRETVAAVEGKYEVDKNSKTLSISEITTEGETYDLGEITFIITYQDKMPTIEKFTDILDLTSENIQAIGMKLIGSLGTLGSVFGGF